MPSDQKLKLTKAPLFWLVTLLLVFAPYQTGLFFERAWLYTFIFTALLIVLGIATRGKRLSYFKTKLDWLGIGLILSYAAGTLTAVNARAAVGETLKLACLLAVYWFTAYGGWNRKDFRALLHAVFWSGFGVAALGILNALGLYPLVGGYLDGRIYSTFQYANTLAAYLGMIILIGAYLWVESKSALRLTYLPGLYVITLCLVATGSRGGIGVLALTIPLFLFLLPSKLRAVYGIRLLWVFVPGAFGSVLFLKYLSENNQTAVWLVMLFLAALGLAAEAFGARLRPLLTDRRILFALVAGVLLLSIIFSFKAAGENPLVRLRTASFKAHEFQERLIYYRDGFSMALDRPLQGFGGGGWALYPRYQSYPYQVTDPHSQPVKIAVESGLPGVAFYLGWWICLGYTAWQKTRQGDVMIAAVFSALMLLGIHSLIDFDLTFGAMGLLLWAGAGLIIAPQNATVSNQKGRFAVAAAGVALAAVLAAAGISFLQAIEYQGWSGYYIQQGRVEEALGQLEQARRFDPFNAAFPAAEAELYSGTSGIRDPNKAERNIAVALRLDSTDPKIKGLARNILAEDGKFVQGAAQAEDYLSFFRLNSSAYLELAYYYQLLSEKAAAAGQKDLSKSFLLRGAGLAEELQTHINQITGWEAGLLLNKPQVSLELRQKSGELAALAKK